MSLRRESCIMPTQLALLRFRLPQPVRHELHRSTRPFGRLSKKSLGARNSWSQLTVLLPERCPRRAGGGGTLKPGCTNVSERRERCAKSSSFSRRPLLRLQSLASMMAISSSSTRAGAAVRASTPVDVMKMMKDAKNLREQSYPAN